MRESQFLQQILVWVPAVVPQAELQECVFIPFLRQGVEEGVSVCGEYVWLNEWYVPREWPDWQIKVHLFIMEDMSEHIKGDNSI